MGLVLDTNVFVRAERSEAPLDFSRWQAYGEVFISAITASELLVGVHRAVSESRRTQRSAFVKRILGEYRILDFTLETARIHAELFATLSSEGQMIGAHDLLIGATALAHDCAVLTTNLHEFERISGLTVLALE